MELSDVKKLKSLEEENARLKKMHADLAIDNQILKDLFTKKLEGLPEGDVPKATIRDSANTLVKQLFFVNKLRINPINYSEKYRSTNNYLPNNFNCS